MKKLFFFATFISYAAWSANSAEYTLLEDKSQVKILNPTFAGRQTAKLRLTNGLEVYLISDPGAPQSAAAVCVEAGCWQDPKEYPGMAHFCEHMLFMGTIAYPNEFEYMKYISENGGTVNASTWPDHTIYMFSINHDAFENAFDRLSHFFIDPLFLRNSIDRELHAVDQEHAKNIENDMWRAEMIFKETGNPNHPNAMFSTGNAQTLSGIPQEALRTWYETNYSSNLMHLVVLSPLSIDELKALAVKNFSRVPNRLVDRPSLNIPMTSPKQLGHITYINPIKDLKMLSLCWEISAPFANDKEHHSGRLLSYVLENQTENSLIQQLKKEKLVDSLEVTIDRFSKEQELFRVDLALTQQGVAQMDQVIERIFQTFALLREKGIPQSTFEEFVKINKLNYQYQSRYPTFEYIYQIGNGLLYEDLQTYPEKSIIPSTYNSEFIAAFVKQFSPTNCMIHVQADPEMTGQIPDTLEKWMNAEYVVRDIQPEKITAWNSVTPNPKIALPGANPYLPSDQITVVSSAQQNEKPKLISNDEVTKIYYAKDSQYLVPEVGILLGIRSPLIDGSPKRKVLLDLYNKALQDKLSSALSSAETAGLHADFSQSNLKFNVSLFGFSEKAPLLTKEIFKNLRIVAPTAEQFDIYKEGLQSAYENQEKELPILQAVGLMMSMITTDSPTAREMAKALKNISYEEFLTFSQQLFKQTYIEGMICGNLDQADAQILSSEIKSLLASTPYPVKQHHKKNVLVLPEKSGPFMVVQNTDRQGNAVLLLVEEGPLSLEKRASQQVLAKALAHSFFDTLRTKQQTAYWAKSWESDIEGQLLQFFSVQSSTHHPSDLISRFELFLEDFTKNFHERMSKERFETIRTQQIALLKIAPENLSRMTLRLNTLAFDYMGDFNWIEKRIVALEALTYEQTAADAQKFLSRSNQKRLAILMEGVLTDENDFRYEQVTKEEVSDLGTYKTWSNRANVAENSSSK